MKKWIKKTIMGILSIILVGFLVPQNLEMLVIFHLNPIDYFI